MTLQVVRRQRDRARQSRNGVPDQVDLADAAQQDRQVRSQQRHRQERGDGDPRHQL